MFHRLYGAVVVNYSTRVLKQNASGAMARVVTDVNSLADLITKSTTLVIQLRNGFYRASRELETFPDLVNTSRLKQEMWEGLLRRYGMSANEFVRTELEIAISVLDREARRMETIQTSCCGGFGHKLLFPEDVEISIQKVIDTFDGLHQKMKDAEDLNDLFDRVAGQTPATLPFSHDKKYVPLKTTISRVEEGLTRADGPRVVTLHGGPGTGKSTLVRYMALFYQDKAFPLRNRRPSCSASNLENPFADGVFFLACGSGAERRSKLAELLQNLGSKIQIEDPSQDGHDQQRARLAAYHTESSLRMKLATRLNERKVLIILDDVWESNVIQSLLVPGKGVRYLVTTQIASVWSDSVRINIETPGLEDARMILVNHVVGLQTSELPIHVQGIADDIISASESHPLILANLALAINGQRATDAGEWELKRNALLDFLEAEGSDDGPVRFEVKYPRSVAASMMVAVNSLEPEAKSMLVLASLCEGPSVPENVVRVFFKSVYGRLVRFVKWADYLEDHSLIQIQTQTVPGSSVYCRSWSIHGSRKHFILKEKAKVMQMISSMVKDSESTAGDGPDADLVAALCYIYIEKSLLPEIRKDSHMSPAYATWFKSSIEPLVWFLQLPGGKEENWQQEAHLRVSQVILRYVGEGRLDDLSIARLLELPQTASATCWALQSMALVQVQPLSICDSECTLMSLLNLLADGGNPSTQRRATEAIGALAEKNHKYILSHQRVLETFMMLLGSDSNPILQEGAAWAIGALAGSKESRDILGGYPGLLETLVGLQSKYTEVHFRVRRSAAYALVQLTTELSSSKPTLEALVALLASDMNVGVQEEAAKCLAKLAGAEENQINIASHPDALKWLFEMLVRTTTPEAKTYACMCLAELSLGRESSMSIKTFPDAVLILEELLSENASETVQTLAAMCLANLDHTGYARSLSEPRKSLSSTARYLMSDEEPDDNLYFLILERNLEEYKRLHMEPWPE